MAGAKHRLEKHKMHKKAAGGKLNEHEYNAKGSPELSEASDKNEGFKKGGHKKMKGGGHAEGKKAHHRLDKKKRGGRNKMAAGGSAFAAAHKVKEGASNSGPGRGHEDDGAGGEDKEND